MKNIISNAKLQIKNSISRPMFRFCIFFGPICNAFLLAMMYSLKNSDTFSLYVLVGTSMSTFWSSICFSSASDIAREKWMGTLPILFTAPTGFKKIMVGRIIGNTFWALVGCAISFITIELFFSSHLKIRNMIFFSITIFMTILTMIALAFMLSGLFVLSRKVRILMNFIEYPMIILTGMVFPINILPVFIQQISKIFSPYWAMECFKASIFGNLNFQHFLILITNVSVLTIIYLLLGIFIFKKIDKEVRILGNIEVY